MIKLKNVKDNYEEVEALHISGEEIQLCSEELISKFKNLKKLKLNYLTLNYKLDNKKSENFLKPFLSLDIEDLEFSGLRIENFKTLNLKRLKTRIDKKDFSILIDSFGELEELDIKIDGDIIIDKSFLKLSNLKKLSIELSEKSTINFDISDLSSLSNLKELKLVKMLSSEFEKEWCSCKNLEILSLVGFKKLKDFPKEIEKLDNVKELYLYYVGSDVKSTKMANTHYIDTTTNMPKNISLIKNLEEFISDSCIYNDFEPLAKLKKLKEIRIEYSDLKTVPDLSALQNLEILDINSNHNIKEIEGLKNLNALKILRIEEAQVDDLTPLKKLKKLEELNISGIRIDTNKFKIILALSELECFETLKTLDSEKLSQEEWENLNKKLYSNLMNKEEILKACKKNDNKNIDLFEKACLSIFDLKDIFEGKINFLSEVKRERIEDFDDILREHVSKLKDDTLKHLINISFANKELLDSYDLTIIVLEEAIRRKSTVVEETMSVAFVKGQKYYEAGDRCRKGTVVDMLIDNIFEKFEEEPLATVLIGTRKALFISDDMEKLFYKFFLKVKNQDLAEKVLKKYKNYIIDNINDIYNKEEVLPATIKLKESRKSIVKNELLEISKLLERLYKIYTTKKLEDLILFLEEINREENKSLLCYTAWDNIVENNLNNFIKLDYEVCYHILLKYMNNLFEKDYGGEQLFFILLLQIDSNRLKTDLVRDIKDSKIISSMGYYNSFDVAHDYFDLFKLVVSGMINGEDETVIQNKEMKRLALIEEKRQKDILEKEISKSLKEKFESAKKDKKEIIYFMEMSNGLAKNKELMEFLSYDFLNYTTKLIIEYLKNGDLEEAKEIFYNYINNLMPEIGSNYDNLASNAIVVGISLKNEEIIDIVFKLLLGENFKIKKIDNKLLAFNLACYYSIKKDRKNLFIAMKQALKLGKSASQFLNDSDFKSYYEDKEFLKILKDSH